MQVQKRSVLFITLCLLVLAGCSTKAPSEGAAMAVESYIQSLVERDETKVIASSCADWEAQAKVEFNSFSAVKLSLEGLNCLDNGQDDIYTLVRCRGTIIANYGAEDLTIDIATRTYRAVEEGGEWRMCGYSKK